MKDFGSVKQHLTQIGVSFERMFLIPTVQFKTLESMIICTEAVLVDQWPNTLLIHILNVYLLRAISLELNVLI